MIIKKNFEQWLQKFDSRLNIRSVNTRYLDENGDEWMLTNPDVEILCYGDRRLCSIPKGLKKARFWTDLISDKRYDSGNTTRDGIAHRSLSGIGLFLMREKIINESQFVKHFTTWRNKDYVEQLRQRGVLRGR